MSHYIYFADTCDTCNTIRREIIECVIISLDKKLVVLEYHKKIIASDIIRSEMNPLTGFLYLYLMEKLLV